MKRKHDGLIPALSCLLLCATPVVAQQAMFDTYRQTAQKYFNEGNMPEAEKLVLQALNEGNKFGPNDMRMGEAYFALAKIYILQADYTKAEDALKRALVIFEARHSDEGMSGAFYNLAGIYQHRGEFALAEAVLNKALLLAEKKGAKSLATAEAFNSFGMLYLAQAKIKEAERCFLAALSIREKLLKKNDKVLAVSLNNLAETYRAQSRFAEAEPLYKRALDITADEPKSREHADQLNNLATCYYGQRKFQLADPLFAQSLAIYEERFGPDHPKVATALNNIAMGYSASGRRDDAEAAYRRAMIIYEKKFGENSRDVGVVLTNLGGLLYSQGKYAESEKMQTKGLAIFEQLLGKEHLDVVVPLEGLGDIYADQGKLDQAEQTFQRRLRISENSLGPDNPKVAGSLYHLAFFYEGHGKAAQAKPLYERSLAIREKSYGVNDERTQKVVYRLASLNKAAGNYADADQQAKRALHSAEATDPRSPMVISCLELLADISAAQKDTAGAAEYSRKAAALKQSLPGAERLKTLQNDLNPFKNKPPSSGADATTSVSSTATAANKPATAAAAAVATAAQNAAVKDKWAIVVGISEFKDPALNLKFAQKDAVDFKNFLISSAQFKPDHVKLLTNADATRDNIVRQLGDGWLGRLANRDDLVVVYISSHGSTTTANLGVNFLVAHDTNKNALTGTGIPMQWLSQIIKEQVHADRVVLILDVCHSGVSMSGEKGLTRKEQFDVEKVDLGTGQAVLCSSLADQVSWESKQYQNSVFTRKLIESLKKNGTQTKLSDAYTSLRSEVESEVLRDRGELQTPVLNMKSWKGIDPSISVTPSSPRPGLPQSPLK